MPQHTLMVNYLRNHISFKFFSSLKRLQVVDLITRSGVFEAKNVSLSTDNFLYTLNEFQKFTYARMDTGINFHFFGRPTFISEILTEYGLCYTFNLATSKEMYDTETVSAEFFHEYLTTLSGFPAFNETIPRFIAPTTAIFIYINAIQSYYDKIFNRLHDAHLVFVHDPYELPTVSMNRFSIDKNVLSTLHVEPIFNSIDESLFDLSINEYDMDLMFCN